MGEGWVKVEEGIECINGDEKNKISRIKIKKRWKPKPSSPVS